MIKGTANAQFSIKTNSDHESDIVEFANSLSVSRGWGELDSLDLGDSMGVFMRAAWEDFYNGEIVNLYMGANGLQIEIDLEFPNFQWEGI